MDYMTLKEASRKMGRDTSVELITIALLGRIPGAVKMATIWLIPKGCGKA